MKKGIMILCIAYVCMNALGAYDSYCPENLTVNQLSKLAKGAVTVNGLVFIPSDKDKIIAIRAFLKSQKSFAPPIFLLKSNLIDGTWTCDYQIPLLAGSENLRIQAEFSKFE